MSTQSKAIGAYRSVVLLVDDQPIIGEAVRRMLAAEPDIEFHHCIDPAKAIEVANHVRPTVILQDLVMPQIDGLTLVRYFRANPTTRETPMIVLSSKEEPQVKAEAFSVGANDYLVKLPDRIELVARVRHHSKGYINQLERDQVHRALVESEQILASELASAARYVMSILPKALEGNRGVRTDWRFVPSVVIGGDGFGYHWIDDDHFAVYLLDVCGHGVGSALLAVSVLDVLRSQSLPGVDLRAPGEVLGALNEAFKMEDHDQRYFTAWYGVFDRRSRTLAYAGGGHPPALLVDSTNGTPRALQLEGTGPLVGMLPGAKFSGDRCQVPTGAKLFVFSDGVYEIDRANDRTMWTFEEFVAFMEASACDQPLDALLSHVRALGGRHDLEDDFSILEVSFD